MYDLVDITLTGLLILHVMFCYIALTITFSYIPQQLDVKLCTFLFLQDYTLQELLAKGNYSYVEFLLTETCSVEKVAIFRNNVLVYGNYSDCTVMTGITITHAGDYYTLVMCLS